MRVSNGFNKKQKEEIREIVKVEIQEALRKNANSKANTKDEVIEAINTILQEKNDTFIKNLAEIEERINMVETEKSLFAANMRYGLKVLCVGGTLFLSFLVLCSIYMFCCGMMPINPWNIFVLTLIFGSSGFIMFTFFQSIKTMTKSDLYNTVMFIVTMISFVITIWTVTK